MMLISLRGLLKKELIQFFRDKVMLVLILWLYTVELILCPVALSFDVKNFPLAVVDHDQSHSSRALIDSFLTSEAFDWVGFPASETAAETWLQQGRAGLVLIIPRGFDRDLSRGVAPSLQAVIDGTNANMAANVKGYVHRIALRFAHDLRVDVHTANRVAVQPVVRVWYNPNQSTTIFMVLSMLALAGMMAGVINPVASLVREKEQGTIEQLLVTPLHGWQIFFSKTLPPLAMGLIAAFPSLLIAAAFAVPFRGSLLFFLIETAIFLLSAISIGVLIGVFSQTMQQGLLLAFFGLFPLMFLSGTVTPIESMPAILQYISLLSPLRYYMDIVLGIFLKGSGLRELWLQTVALLLIGIGIYAAALQQFKRRYL